MANSSFLRYMDYFLKHILGKVLVVLVYGIMSFIAFEILFIALPYESLHKPKWFICILCFVAAYFIFSILYYYYKASKTPPGSPKKKTGTPFCYRCQNFKPFNAHHCHICDICVLNMDHHCVWINQCVGAQNHRFFLQFIGFLTVGCFLFVVVTYPTFYHNYWNAKYDTFCNRLDLDYLSWKESFCRNGQEFVMTSVFFAYCLAGVVFFLVGGLFWWNFSLISSGQTYIEFLKNGEQRGCMPMVLWPFGAPHFRRNWENFLGLRNGKSFIRHILLPSNHLTYTDEEDLARLTIV
ncbi:unnamed protein product [Bursaphelenchus okinawaensis]|uniref:Palmitoyltransferase n=1 Tax=Bursaphelenchus okinawaensis TaxID=465554 RepID=A0A811KIH5_9BILA|nr:unnamed protein product [Bursaphelenchus okinawaensis]CAG9105291.1 unnamed protein product [Bursaphelenchus okinawaensis]